MQYMVFGGLPSTDAAEPVLRNCAGSINTKPEPANWAAAVVVLDACNALWVLRTAHCNELGVVLLSRVPRIDEFNHLNETRLVSTQAYPSKLIKHFRGLLHHIFHCKG